MGAPTPAELTIYDALMHSMCMLCCEAQQQMLKQGSKLPGS